MKKIFISWQKYQEDLQALERIVVRHCEKHGKFEAIGAIPRGGVVPAICLSYCLKTLFLTEIECFMYKEKILLVDDLVDSGETMKTWTKKYPLIHTATLYRKDCTKFEPEFVVRTINEWIVMPWETEETSKRDNF